MRNSNGVLRLWSVDEQRQEQGDALAAREPSEGEAVGEFLRRRRENRNETVRDVSASLRIRTTYLRAIEADNWDELPNGIYARAFVRSYAMHVGAEPDAVLARLDGVLAYREGPKAPLRPILPKSRGFPGGAVASVSVLLLIAAYAGWYYYTIQDLRDERVAVGTPTSLLVPERPAPSRDIAGESASTADGSGSGARITSESASRGPEEQASGVPGIFQDVAPAEAAGQLPGGEVVPQAGAGLPAVAAPVAEPGAVGEPGSVAGDAAVDHGRDLSASASGIVLRAVQDTYIEVRSEDTGETVFAELLVAGNDYRVPERTDLVFDVGNAGGLEVVVDGEIAPPLGGRGIILRRVELKGDRLLRGTDIR